MPYKKKFILMSLYGFILASCTAAVDLNQACTGVDTSNPNLPINCASNQTPGNGGENETPIDDNDGILPPLSFSVAGTISGPSISGKKVFCSTIEASPSQASQTLDGTGTFSLTFNRIGQMPVRCLMTETNNTYITDIIFTETVTRSIKNAVGLNSLVVIRKSDSTTLNLGTVTYTGTTATAPLSSVTQNGAAVLTNNWLDLTGVWAKSSDVPLTTFSNNMTVDSVYWNQASATDDLSQSHTGLSSWIGVANSVSCQRREGYNLQPGWTATVNPTAFAVFSEPLVSFATGPAATQTSGYADFIYAGAGQNICGVNLDGSINPPTCDNVTFPPNYAGLNAAQCRMLCILKSIDALAHFEHPSFNTCPFEYKTDLTGNLATKLPTDGLCTAANGDPCPGLIMKPERVLSRNFFEEAKIMADVASFQITRVDSVRSCIDANSDGDLNDVADCAVCGYEEKRYVIVRQMSASQAYVSQRRTRTPLVTNSPTICTNTGAPPPSDDSFAHRLNVDGLATLTAGDQQSQTYIMTK